MNGGAIGGVVSASAEVWMGVEPVHAAHRVTLQHPPDVEYHERVELKRDETPERLNSENAYTHTLLLLHCCTNRTFVTTRHPRTPKRQNEKMHTLRLLLYCTHRALVTASESSSNAGTSTTDGGDSLSHLRV